MYKISIPKPCHENWNDMLPNEQGRHCLQCCKTVIDFTNMTDQDVQQYFLNKKEGNTCGRFKTKQLNEIIVEISIKKIPLKTSWIERFKIAAFLVFGTFLFSCTNNENEQVGKIIVTDTTENLIDDSTKTLKGRPQINTNTTEEIATLIEPKATTGIVCIEPQKDTSKITARYEPKIDSIYKNTNEPIIMGDIAPIQIDTPQETHLMGKPVLKKE